MSSVNFEGDPPFGLPAAQSASARAAGGTVEMILMVLSPEGDQVPVHVMMTHAIAGNLAPQLLSAAIAAELAGK